METQKKLNKKCRFVLNPSLKFIFCGEDEILVLHGMRSKFNQTIRDEGRTHLLGRVLRRLESPTSLQDLQEQEVIGEEELEDAEELLSTLTSQGFLSPANANPIASYLNTIVGGNRVLDNICVGIIGAGYLGSRVAEELAKIGVGQIQILDDRRIENTVVDQAQFNLPPTYIEKGQPYVECLRSYLSEIGYDCLKAIEESYHNQDALESLFSASNFVVATSEVFSSHFFHTIDLAALAAEKPWMSVFMDGSEASIGPIYVPGETCCYNEFEIQSESTLSIQHSQYYTYKEEMSKNGLCSHQFAFPPYASIAAGFVAGITSSFLLSSKSSLIGRCFRINFEKPYVDYEEILKLPRSPVSVDMRNGYRQIFL
jgi:molybdopterin/thiamine biosynthesis adenylyltransferase